MAHLWCGKHTRFPDDPSDNDGLVSEAITHSNTQLPDVVMKEESGIEMQLKRAMKYIEDLLMRSGDLVVEDSNLPRINCDASKSQQLSFNDSLLSIMHKHTHLVNRMHFFRAELAAIDTRINWLQAMKTNIEHIVKHYDNAMTEMGALHAQLAAIHTSVNIKFQPLS